MQYFLYFLSEISRLIATMSIPFIRTTFSIVITLFLCLSGNELLAAEYELLYIGPENSNGYRGLQQGLDEANHQGQFLGLEFTIKTINTDNFSPQAAGGAIAIIVDSTADKVKQIIDSMPDVAVLDIGSTADSLRLACYNNGFYILPSDKMLEDAKAQWYQKNPDSKAHAQAWHHDFEKYAARDLNKRYKAANSVPMDDQAWAGWAAAKIVTDSLVRQETSDRSRLLAYLKKDLVFDGQKGVEMQFRENGQLRQILLLVENDRIVGEAPVRGVVDATNLDSLGHTNCER